MLTVLFVVFLWVQYIDEQPLGRNVVVNEGFDCFNVSFGEILHELGRLERPLDLLQDALARSTYGLELGHDLDKVAAAVPLADFLSQLLVSDWRPA